jgi:radical SAM superfamily enzyme YgiQ (UPF0313 family)
MKMLLVYPEIQSSVTNTATYSLPLGLGAIATFCRKIFSAELEIKILDGSMITHTEQLENLEKFVPHIIGLSPTIASMGNAYDLARRAKELGAVVVFGGINSTNLWKQMLTNRSFIDAVVLYEGEEAMEEIIRRWILGKRSTDLLIGIRNVACRNEKGDVIGPEEIRVFNLKELPNIDYDLFDLRRYFAQTMTRGFGRALSYYAGKGCSKRSTTKMNSLYVFNEYSQRVRSMNTCSFCGRNELGFRCLPSDREKFILQQLHEQYDVRGFFNVQDTVNLTDDTPVELENCWFRLFIGLESITRANIDRLMRRYGPNLILQAGVEAATLHVRQSMGKIPISEEKIFANVEMLAKQNIQLHASFIFGGRGETKESMNASASMAKQLANYPNVTWILISPQLILPGSPDYLRLLNSSEEMQNKWASTDLIDIVDINRDFLRHFTRGLSREMILDEIKSVFADIRSQTLEQQLVLDVKGVIPKEEQDIAPRRYYCDEDKKQ